MKKCKSCQEEISDKAKKCPKCQADQRNWFVKHKITTAILALIVIAGISSAMGGGSKTPSSANATPTPVATAVDAKAFADEFDANAVAASSKYKGKAVQLTSVISNITDSHISFYNVASSQTSMTQISCSDSDKSQLTSVQNGQTVTVKGTVSGQTVGVIGLDNCSIVK